jgi:pyroglutamyl-peptidase
VVELPVVAGVAEKFAREAIERVSPELCLALGEAAPEPWEVRLERTYHNEDHFRIPDNAGNQWGPVPIEPGGAAVQYSTLDLIGLAFEAPVPVRVSDDAGRFLCNRLAYSLASSYQSLPLAFVHVPGWRPEHGAEKLGALVETLALFKGRALRR